MHKKIISAIIGFAIVLAIGMSLLTGQKSTFAWSSNADILDTDFFLNDLPLAVDQTGFVINALFGDGMIGADTSYYTQYWQSNTCDVTAMNVIWINPGSNLIPATLSPNTIYILLQGNHQTNYPIVFGGDCIALVGQYTPSVGTGAWINVVGTFTDGILLSGVTNNIIANIIYQSSNISNLDHNIGLYNTTNSTINTKDTRYALQADIYMDNADYNHIHASTYGSPIGYHITNGSDNNRFGGQALQNSIAGRKIENSSNNIFNNTTSRLNLVGSKGYWLENTNDTTFQSSTTVSNNGIGAFITGGTNVTMTSFIASGNNDVGIYIDSITGLVLNNIQANQNTGHGIQIMNTTGITGDNIATHGAAGSNYGLTLSDSQNISITNHYATGNGGYGIELYQVDNFNLQSINESFNNVGGGNIYGSTSGVINNMTGADSTRSNGLIVDGLSSDISITDSYFARNNEDGVYLEGGLNIFMDNIRSFNNTGNGVKISALTGFSLTDYISQGNGFYGVWVKSLSNSGTLFSGDAFSNFGGMRISDGTDIVVDTLNVFQNTTFGVSLRDSMVNIVRNVNARENGNDGVFVDTSDLNTLTNITTYNNSWNGLSFNAADQNRGINIVSFNNTTQGILLNEKSVQNKLNYIQTYNNNVGINVVDDLSERNVLSNIITYNNFTNASVYNYTTVNNIVSFNGGKGVIFAGPYNVLNNANIFNNQDGIYIDETANNISLYKANVYNNLNGVHVNFLSSANTYNGLKLFANTNAFVDTNGNDALLSPTVYSWTYALANNLSGSDIMTCNRAVQATNNSGSNLLQYPYCDTRGIVSGWTGSLGVSYTFFPNIEKQIYPVEYIIPLPTIITTTPDPEPMFIGDYMYSGADAFGGYITVTGEQSQFTYQSGGFTYKNANNTDIDMLVNQLTPTNYVITGVNSLSYDGITAQIGYLPFASLPTYLYSTLYLDKTAGLNIARIAYNDIDSQSNYYGFIRGIAMNDDISITKTASSGVVIPGNQIGFTITVTNSGSDPAGASQVIDFLPTSIDGGSLIASPTGVYTGDLHAYIRDIPVVSGNSTYTFYLTGTVNPGTIDTQLLNSGYFISDQTSHTGDWIITDEISVDILLPINGGCGTAQTNLHYGQSALTSGTIDLCGQGTVSGFVGPDLSGGYAWTCLGINSGSDALCTADENRCGDDTINTPQEQCDEGDTNGFGGCSATCQFESPSCTLSANPSYPVGFLTTYIITQSVGSEIYTFDLGNGTGIYQTGIVTSPYYYTYGSAGVYTATVYVQNPLNTSYTGSCNFEVTISPVCGNSVLESGEQCDDGNTNAGDGCSNFCTLDTGLCSLQAVVSTGYTPFNVVFNGTGSSGFIFDYIDYGDGTTGSTFNHTYAVSGTYNVVGYEHNMWSGGVVNTCMDQVIVYNQPPMCEVVLQPGFEITSYQTVPYVGTGGGIILSDIEFTSITTGVNSIVDYQWNIYSSGDFLSGMVVSPYIFDNSLIVAGQGTPTVNINFSQYVTDGNRPFIRVSLTVTDSLGYQAEYSTPFLRTHDEGGLYWIVGDTISGSSFNGFTLDIIAEMLSSATSGIVPTNQFFLSDIGLIPTVIGIDRENDTINDEFFDYTGAHANNTTYTTGVHTLNLNTSIGSTLESFPMSYRTYPVACAVSCGNGVLEGVEQCDDGNDTNLDGCSSQCQIEVLGYCGDSIVDTSNGSGFMEQCDDGNTDEFDGCTSQCITNSCVATVDSLVPTFSMTSATASGWELIWTGGSASGTRYYDATFESTTTGLGLTYQRYRDEFINTTTGAASISGSTTGQSFVLDFSGVSFVVTGSTMPYIRGALTLDVAQGLNTTQAQGIVIITKDGPMLIAAQQNPFSFSGLTLSSQDETMLWIADGLGGVIQTGIQNFIPSYDGAYKDRYPLRTSVVSGVNLTGLNNTFIHTYVSGNDDVTPYFGFDIDQLFGPITGVVVTGATYQQSYISYTNSCFIECGNGVLEVGEQCDLGGSNGNGTSGCSATCEYVNPSCILTAIPLTGNAPLITQFTGILESGAVFSGISYGDSSFGTSASSTHTYTTGGVFPAVMTVVNPLTGGISAQCDINITSTLLFCGNSVVDTINNETCDLGSLNGQRNSGCSNTCQLEQVSCTINGYNVSGNAPLTVLLGMNPWTVGSYYDYGNGMTGTASVYPYTSGGTYTVTGYTPHPILTGVMISCPLASQIVVSNVYQEPFCTTPLLPSFEIVSFQTGIVVTGSNISELILTDTTIAVNTISGYERHIYTSDSYFTSGVQGTLDDVWIVTGADSNTLTLDLSGFDYDSMTMWVSLLVTDSSGYQGESYYMLSYPDASYQGFWSDELTQTSFSSGGLLTLTGSLFANSINNGVVGTQMGSLSILVSGQSDTVTFIDRESDLTMDGNFINNTLSYGTSHQYTTGLHLMRVYTAFGNTGDAQATSYTSYPVICGQSTELSCFSNNYRRAVPNATSLSLACRSTCGDAIEQGKEQCDDGNLIDGDGCSSSCTLEAASCDWFVQTIETNTSGAKTVSWSIGPNVYTGGYQMPGIVRGDGSLTGDIFTGNTHTYTGVGSYTGSLITTSPVVCSPLSGPKLQTLASRSFLTEELSRVAYSNACGSKRSNIVPVNAEITYSSRADTSGLKWKGIETENISVMCPFILSVLCTEDSQCSDGLVCTQDGICEEPICTTNEDCEQGEMCSDDGICEPGVCPNGAINYSACNQCGAGQFYCSVSDSCRNNGQSCGGSSSSRLTTDYCPAGDFSPSYYDKQCGSAPVHGSAPVGKFCIYDDEEYLGRGSFDDIFGHRGELSIEVMRVSCLHRGRHTKEGLRRYEPNANIQRDEALKTLVKIIGVEFEDFDIKSEELLYTGVIPFADVSYNNWFSHYATYAFTKGLTEGLYTTKLSKNNLSPTKNMTRYEAAKAIVIAYEKIQGTIEMTGSTLSKITDVLITDTNYSYVRKAEIAGLIQGYPQKNGTFLFNGNGSITRAEFAKIIAAAFNEQLIDVDTVVTASSAYAMIIQSIQKTQGDKLTFIRNLFEKIKLIDDNVFLRKFKIQKTVFIKTLTDKILLPMIKK